MANVVVDYNFYLLVMIAIVVYRMAVKHLPSRGQQTVLIVLSAFFLAQFSKAPVFTVAVIHGFKFYWLPNGIPHFFLLMLCYVAGAVGIGAMMNRIKEKQQRRPLLLIGSALAVGTLILFKYDSYTHVLFGEASWLDELSAWHWVGLSYTTFRGIDFLLAMRSGRVKEFSIIASLAYMLFFVPIAAGPINRYQPFLKGYKKKDDSLWDLIRLRDNFFRASIGILKILFLAKWAYYNSILADEFAAAGSPSFLELTWGLYAYYLFIYFDFSGYCDCVIVIANCFGITLPENFRYPIISSSIQDFWNRWHISLSHWCRDHFFFPILTSLSKRASWIPQIVASSIAIFITFAIIGAWHGDTIYWFLYGCYHGLGLAVFQIYNHLLKAYCPDFRDRMQQNWVYKAAMIFITFNFVAWGLLLTIEFEKAAMLMSL
ncbi:MAG: hypothetical protein IH984_10710 [Planctomycetes bacterium]|nr:hypothetical protein [Planctomycetota bacterium]